MAFERIDLSAIEGAGPSALERQFAAWSKGIGPELVFWDKWFATKGLHWPDEYQDRVQRRRAFPEWLARLAGVTGSSRVLDVGAGPLTVLGRSLPGDEHEVSITACDPLAHHYAMLAKKYGVEPPIPTMTALAEDLSAFFPVDSFDLTYCQNALDHSFSPLRGIIEMLLVTRPGGKTVLHHQVNEAERGRYDGFHQWNFCLKNERFHIWNHATDIDVADVLSGFATTSAYVKDGRVTAVLARQEPVASESLLTWKNGRIREFLTLSPVNKESLPTPPPSVGARAVRKLRKLAGV